MSIDHDFSHSIPLHFALDPIGAVWCNVRIEAAGQVHEAMIDARHHSPMRGFLSSLLELREPVGRESAGDRVPGFTWEGPANTYRWSLQPRGKDLARLVIVRSPNAFGDAAGVKVFDAPVAIGALLRQACHQARKVLRPMLRRPESAPDAGNPRPDFPIEEWLRVRALVTGRRVWVPRGLKTGPLYRGWCERMLGD